jgi:hypothetical protein
MIVGKPRLQVQARQARLAATVESETGAFSATELFVGVPRCHARLLDLSGNAFVPGLLLLAGTLGERLRLEAPVSPLLLHGAERASRLHQSLWGLPAGSVEAEPAPVDRFPAAEGAALFFRRGVSCWHAALRARNGELPETITHLLYSADLDRHTLPAAGAHSVDWTREAAEGMGFPLVAVSCNARDLLDRFVPWERSRAGALAGIGLALGNGLHSVVIASSAAGIHGDDLDPLWSTEQTRIRAECAGLSRVEQIRALAHWPDALSLIKVCEQSETERNCGRCEKCLYAQCVLALAGFLKQTSAFEHVLTPAALDALSAPAAPWAELVSCFPAGHRLAKLRIAVENLVARAGRDPAGSPPRVEAGPGLASSLLPRAIARLLPAPVTVRGQGGAAGASEPSLEITWAKPAPGHGRLPLRPTAAQCVEILRACRDRGRRPVPWCMIDLASEASAALMVRLTESWGAGIALLAHAPLPGGDHGVSWEEAARVQRCSRLRAWWGPREQLDPFRVLAALAEGCFPLQFVAQEDHAELVAHLPERLAAFTLGLPRVGPLPRLEDGEVEERLDLGLSVILAGSLERDLEQAFQRIKERSHAAC